MSTKVPPPCPPPRPDLETDSSVSKPSSRAAPPPIPLRPDLGEGADENVVNIPKIPPPTLPKKPSIKKKQGRPEISIISAQPMSSSGAFVPFVPEPSVIPAPSPEIVPQLTAKETESKTFVPPSVNDHVLDAKPHLAAVPGHPTPFDATPEQSLAHVPSDFAFRATNVPSMQDSASAPIAAPVQPTKSASFVASPNKSTSDTMVSSSFSPVVPAPNPIPINTMTTLQPTKPAPQIPTNVFKENSPQKVIKSNKPREPPQRPKTKPVCEPSLATDPFNVSFPSNEAIEKPAEPIPPKRTKNKPKKPLQESEGKGLGINNSAFQELEAGQADSVLLADVEVKKDTEIPSSSKKGKLFPTVIRTKPNGKENPKNNASPSYQDDLVQLDSTQVRYTKPTIIKPQGRSKAPAPPLSQKQDQDTGNPSQVPITPTSEAQPQQSKAKAKPTIIIPKVKKDESKKSEAITSPPELTKTEFESKSNLVEEKFSKPKRMPNIIRPNRAKKDKNTVDNSQSNSRGMPEGQSHESSQAKPKIVPIRKAPPRPSPPKPGPPRPGPPKKLTNELSAPQIRTQPAGTVTTDITYPENKGKAPPRPATIGKEKGTDKKQKNIESTVVSSVVETKIEPSCIALHDYTSANPDDLSFKAGDEIFLIQRVNPDWYIGRLGDCEGMMPVKFVEIIEDLPVETEKPATKVSAKSSSLNALVLYDFPGQSPDELTLHAGDTVLLLELINDDWLKGTCNGVTGMFPSNFVDFTQEIKQTLSQQKKNIKTGPTSVTVVSSGPRCKALYDYHTDNDDDLKFNKNDIIKLMEKINMEWLKGEVHGVTGMFPAAYVDIIEDLVEPSSTSTSTKGSSTSNQPVARALHDYISDTDGDLSFREGEMISIVNKISDEWLEGELHGKKGIFPAAFVENVGIDKSKPQDHLLPKAKALYDFIGESDQELSFKTGDEIFLLQNVNSDWMEGELDGHIGQFPTAFVEVLVPLP